MFFCYLFISIRFCNCIYLDEGALMKKIRENKCMHNLNLLVSLGEA